MSEAKQKNVLGDPRERAVSQRFEAKYFLTELQAEMIRDYILPYTLADRHQRIYPVTSIYLDTDDLMMFQSSLYGEKNRYKLRVRAYENNPEKPVFAEVKQRMGRIIRKHRASIRRDTINRLHWSEPFTEEHLVDPEDEIQKENLMLFAELCERMGAEPKVCVRYQREAYVSDLEEPVRITFDTNISYAPVPDDPLDLWRTSQTWALLDEIPIVLEIKFTDTYPLWVRRMIQRFQLDRISLAKYVMCVQAMQREGGYFDAGQRSFTTWN